MVVTNVVAMNLSSFEYCASLNQRFSNLPQSPFEYIFDILYSPYKSTIFFLTDTRSIGFTKMYYQHLNSQFNTLITKTQAFSLIYYPNKDYKITIIVSCLAFILFFVFSLIFYAFWKKKKYSNYIQLPDFAENSIQNNLESILTDKSIPKIKYKHLKIGKTIGIGGQALVREGEFKNKQIAAKSILYLNSESQLNEFLREIKLLCSFKHPNIITTYGICENQGEIL